MEAAVLIHDGQLEQDRWCGLVRPRRPVSPFAQRFTGITPDMFQGAPSFAMIASRLRHLIGTRVMVAHNVRYDATVLRNEFERAGLAFNPATLCTERLARQLAPNLAHYNLRSLCRHLGIAHAGPHRAEADAEATLAVLLRFLADHGAERVLATVEPPRQKAA